MEESVQKGFNTKVGEGAPKENRRELAGKKAVAVELCAGAGQQGYLFL
jgi:hypothetical protein